VVFKEDTVTKQMPRVGAVHALQDSIGATHAAFRRNCPGIEIAHLLDGSLYLDRSAGSADDAELEARIDRLLAHSAQTGSDAIIFTGSFFGKLVDNVRTRMDVPVLTSFEALIDECLATNGATLRVLSSAPDSATLLSQEIESVAQTRGIAISLESGVVGGAMDALVSGDLTRHDELVVNGCAQVPDDRVLILAQFSMERVFDVVRGARTGITLGPADAASKRLHAMLIA
jgi:hypothetical protein